MSLPLQPHRRTSSPRRWPRVALGVLALVGVAACNRKPEVWPGERWTERTPIEAGFDPAALDAALAYAGEQHSTGIVVVRGGEIVAERYWNGWGPETSWFIASATKSMVGTLVGTALDDGALRSLDQPVADFVPTWRGTPKEAITLRHLMTMTSGLQTRGILDETERDQLDVVAEAPLGRPPGTAWEYSTPAYSMLFRILERATGTPFESYARDKLFTPLGMQNLTWAKHEIAPGVTNYFRVLCSTRDLARFGVFLARDGRWRDRRLVHAATFAAAARSSTSAKERYGLLLWLGFAGRRGDASLSPVPIRPGTASPSGEQPDFLFARGADDQLALAVPALDLVIARHGSVAPDREFPDELLHRVRAAMTDGPRS